MIQRWTQSCDNDIYEKDSIITYVSMTERLSNNNFFIDKTPHIIVNQSICSGCEQRTSIHACPAELFVELHDGSIGFNYEQCLECGTCLILCSKDGALTWNYPNDGRGVSYRYG